MNGYSRKSSGAVRPVALVGGVALSIGMAALLAGCQLPGSNASGPTATANASLVPNMATGSASSNELSPSPSPLVGAAATPAVDSQATQSAVSMQTAFEQVARSAEPAVVTITTLQRVPTPPRGNGSMPFPFSIPQGRGRRNAPNGGDQDPTQDFFRQFQQGFGAQPGSYNPGRSGTSLAGPGFRKTQATGPLVGVGLGSGFLIRSDGLILTNAHVVKDADRVTVKLADGREFRDARVLGQDARTDLAVVKIPATNLPTVTLGNSDNIHVGDWAIAVGNPFGLEHTVTVGVISAKARQVPLSDSGPGDYLQTDASINPGNSGGPLLDIYGRVIGINNAIYSESGGNVGIGFAIPITSARSIAETLAKGERIHRARLGVAVTDIGDQPQAFGLPAGTHGAMVESIEPNSPAAKSGLQAGDVVTAINGQPVINSADLQERVTSGKIGSSITLQTLHNGATKSITPTLDEAKDDIAPMSSHKDTSNARNSSPQAGRLGIGLAALTPDIAHQLGLNGSATGVVIAQVQSGSPAQIAGLRVGDVIQRVGQAGVSAPEDVKKYVDQILTRQPVGDQRGVALYIIRGGEGQYVVVGL